MFESIVSFVSNIFAPAGKIIDNLHTSTEEKLKLRNALFALQSRTLIKLNEFVVELSKAQAQVIQAEMKYGNWLTRSWRPVTMLIFVALILLDTFGLLAKPLNDNIWTLIQLGLGGYVVGRSAEKIVKDYNARKSEG